MTQRACLPPTPTLGFDSTCGRKTIPWHVRYATTRRRIHRRPGVPQHGVDRLWRRFVQPVGVTGDFSTIPWKRRTSRCRKSRVVNELLDRCRQRSPRLTHQHELVAEHSLRPSRKSFHEWETIQWRRWNRTHDPCLQSRCSNQLSYVPWLSKKTIGENERAV